jgi:hypothetical protein
MTGRSLVLGTSAFLCGAIALYSRGYLSKENSRFALEMLLETTFADGLVAALDLRK